MSKLFLGRLLLVGALLAVSVAAFWPHVRPAFQKSSSLVFEYLLSYRDSNIPQQNSKSIDGFVDSSPPKFSGRSLKRSMDAKDSSKADHGPDYHHHYGGINPKIFQQKTNQSSPLLPIFSITIIGLLIYILFKTFIRRFNSVNSMTRDHQNTASDFDAHTQTAHLDKSKLQKLNKEERVKELIKFHGGRNVSQAIRYLAAELNRQKQRLLSESDRLLKEAPRYDVEMIDDCCSCICHNLRKQDEDISNELVADTQSACKA